MRVNGQKTNAAKCPHWLGGDRQAGDQEDEGEGATACKAALSWGRGGKCTHI